jgi:hypothetical protein
MGKTREGAKLMDITLYEMETSKQELAQWKQETSFSFLINGLPVQKNIAEWEQIIATQDSTIPSEVRQLALQYINRAIRDRLQDRVLEAVELFPHAFTGSAREGWIIVDRQRYHLGELIKLQYPTMVDEQAKIAATMMFQEERFKEMLWKIASEIYWKGFPKSIKYAHQKKTVGRRGIQDEFTDLPLSRQRKWQLRKQKQKLCTVCGAPASLRSKSSICDSHLKHKRKTSSS